MSEICVSTEIVRLNTRIVKLRKQPERPTKRVPDIMNSEIDLRGGEVLKG